jgi:hypothetical protein
MHRAIDPARTLFLRKIDGEAGMAELADAADSKPADFTVMGVQFPLPAPDNVHVILDLGKGRRRTE